MIELNVTWHKVLEREGTPYPPLESGGGWLNGTCASSKLYSRFVCVSPKKDGSHILEVLGSPKIWKDEILVINGERIGKVRTQHTFATGLFTDDHPDAKTFDYVMVDVNEGWITARMKELDVSTFEERLRLSEDNTVSDEEWREMNQEDESLSITLNESFSVNLDNTAKNTIYNYNGPLNKEGYPRMKPLRRHLGYRITKRERNELWDKRKDEDILLIVG